MVDRENEDRDNLLIVRTTWEEKGSRYYQVIMDVLLDLAGNALSRPTKKKAKKKKDGVPISDNNAFVSTPVYTAVDTSAIDTNTTNTASPDRIHKNKPSTSSSTTTTTRGTKTPREGRKKKQARRVCDSSNVNKNNNLTSAVMVSRSI